MARRYDIRRVKIHRSYDVPEVEELLGVHPRTMRQWINRGLPLIVESRPRLIHGSDLRAFLKARRASKQPLRPGEFYCLPCRARKSPDGGFAEYRPSSPTLGTLTGLCPTCGRIINRRVSLAKIDRARGGLEVLFPTPSPRLIDSPDLHLNTHFGRDVKP